MKLILETIKKQRNQRVSPENCLHYQKIFTKKIFFSRMRVFFINFLIFPFFTTNEIYFFSKFYLSRPESSIYPDLLNLSRKFLWFLSLFHYWILTRI